MKTELKACKKCKGLYEKDGKKEPVCPDHPEERLTSEWYGFIFIQDAANSTVASQMGITREGKYAIKVRQ